MNVLIVVDMLHDFVDPGGALVVPGASGLVSRISGGEDGLTGLIGTCCEHF